ncbi:CLUMA_CG008773, isoform A [Clunio marinus]|uniref:CLUMA_CG008773, isoform A n=1 Tax=Clunio marinus TaxID=568069 RepID=A0A1J1I4G1_9DIPT|nr:CLUMA_CG008773, isoform A [Clunio marinus]
MSEEDLLKDNDCQKSSFHQLSAQHRLACSYDDPKAFFFFKTFAFRFGLEDNLSIFLICGNLANLVKADDRELIMNQHHQMIVMGVHRFVKLIEV